jgi:hypothetical protein
MREKEMNELGKPLFGRKKVDADRVNRLFLIA